MILTIRATLRLSGLLAITCVIAGGEEKKPRLLNDPEELFSVREHGDLGFYGSELRSDRVLPLNWIARMHPKEKEQTIYRISRTGGWSRDSFLIVPSANKNAFVIDWHDSRWNRKKGPEAGKGMPEDIITTWYFHTPNDTDRIKRILDNRLFKSPEKVDPLKVGKSGDDYPFLLIERFGPKGYDGLLIAPELYHFQFKEEAEKILENLRSFFLPENAQKQTPEQGSAETADEIARQTVPSFVGFDNGLDHSPEGRRKTALNNAAFNLEHFMASDKVPEGVRISYALSKLKEQMRGCIFKEADRTNKGEFAFEVDEKGNWVVDEEKTRVMREQLAEQIQILEQRLAEIYNPHKEAEQDGTGQPATQSRQAKD